jgi:hypothetical protein
MISAQVFCAESRGWSGRREWSGRGILSHGGTKLPQRRTGRISGRFGQKLALCRVRSGPARVVAGTSSSRKEVPILRGLKSVSEWMVGRAYGRDGKTNWRVPFGRFNAGPGEAA